MTNTTENTIEMTEDNGDFAEIAKLAVSIGLAEEVGVKGDGYVLRRPKGDPYSFRSLDVLKAFVLGAAEAKQTDLEGYDEGAIRSRVMQALVDVIAEVMRRFGTYDEVFLTPCIRHIDAMPEDVLMGIESYDFIALMTAVGAARVEKRKGDLHPFSVLIIDRKHPLVIKATSSSYMN